MFADAIIHYWLFHSHYYARFIFIDVDIADDWMPHIIAITISHYGHCCHMLSLLLHYARYWAADLLGHYVIIYYHIAITAGWLLIFAVIADASRAIGFQMYAISQIRHLPRCHCIMLLRCIYYCLLHYWLLLLLLISYYYYYCHWLAIITLLFILHIIDYITIDIITFILLPFYYLLPFSWLDDICFHAINIDAIDTIIFSLAATRLIHIGHWYYYFFLWYYYYLLIIFIIAFFFFFSFDAIISLFSLRHCCHWYCHWHYHIRW